MLQHKSAVQQAQNTAAASSSSNSTTPGMNGMIAALQQHQQHQSSRPTMGNASKDVMNLTIELEKAKRKIQSLRRDREYV